MGGTTEEGQKKTCECNGQDGRLGGSGINESCKVGAAEGGRSGGLGVLYQRGGMGGQDGWRVR